MKNQTEIERKFIINMPDLEKLSLMDGYDKSEIEQTYLSSSPAVTHRVRARKHNDRIDFTETKKVRISGMSAYEDEQEIGENEFSTLKKTIANGTTPIVKTRHTFLYHGQLFEVDIYPNWKSTAIMETELPSEDTNTDIPPFIKIIKEVTGIKAYSNASMSRAFPDEITE